MWLMTPIGFYSAVQHRNQPDLLIVRARAREDLERLADLDATTANTVRFGPFGPIQETPSADYRWRVTIPRERWALLVTRMALLIDYPNFKDAVKDVDAERAELYMDVWSVLGRAQDGGPYAEAPLLLDERPKLPCELCTGRHYAGKRHRRRKLTGDDRLICADCEDELRRGNGYACDLLGGAAYNRCEDAMGVVL